MLNENNIKYFAVNGENQQLMEMLGQHPTSVDEIPAEVFDRLDYAYTRNGSCNLGKLYTEPKFVLSRSGNFDSSQEQGLSTEEKIQSKNWVVTATMTYQPHFWKDSEGTRKSRWNYVLLMFSTPGAKRVIMNYHKGDSIMVEGRLETMPDANPYDATSLINANYISVDSFLCNAGQTVRKHAQTTLIGQMPEEHSYKTPDDVFNDPSLSEGQKLELLKRIMGQTTSAPAQNEPAPRQTASNNTNKTSNHTDLKAAPAEPAKREETTTSSSEGYGYSDSNAKQHYSSHNTQYGRKSAYSVSTSDISNQIKRQEENDDQNVEDLDISIAEEEANYQFDSLFDEWTSKMKQADAEGDLAYDFDNPSQQINISEDNPSSNYMKNMTTISDYATTNY